MKTNSNLCLPEISDADLLKIGFLWAFVWAFEKRQKLAEYILQYPNFSGKILAERGIKLKSSSTEIRRLCGC